jgi:predicted transcriptional regulator
MQTATVEQLFPTDAQSILDKLPTRIRTALTDDLRSVVDHRATEIEYPIERVVEMAIASFLDTEAIGFADCKPGRGQ